MNRGAGQKLGAAAAHGMDRDDRLPCGGGTSGTASRYHDALMAAGVRDYSFDVRWHDSRYSVLWQITTPLWQAAHALAPVIWWNKPERIMLAVHDLGCLELLD